MIKRKTEYECMNFHESTKDFEHKKYYPNYKAYVPLYKSYPNSLSFPLTISEDESSVELVKTIIKRTSTREFDSSILSFYKLSNIIDGGCSMNNLKESRVHSKRKYPSAGALYPIEVYVAVFFSDELVPGIYHYNVLDNTFELIKEGDCEDHIFNKALYQEGLKGCSHLVILTAVFDRTLEKYGDRGYRYVFLDAGHIGQNLYLMSVDQSVDIVALGGFNDDVINNLLGINKFDESAIYLFALGGGL